MVFQRYSISLLLFLLFTVAVHPLPVAIAKDIQGLYSPEETGFIENGGYAVKKNGRIIAAHNLHKKFVPASIVKIATSLTALKVLGPNIVLKPIFIGMQTRISISRALGIRFLYQRKFPL